ncbi:hypothetical protein FLA4_07700 [Candidatus Rickettsia kotlanii]|nr:hypothetical protein FLA4_07700 [Candidatus Rickettsia kotlanii]BDU61603.1 hypothetical protein HM2_07710 [Candidatus Rickettsia kotlanii]
MKKSARHSYTKVPINSDTQNIGAANKEDGYNMMRLGIEIATEVAAKKLDKQISSLTYEELKKYGLMILFNGKRMIINYYKKRLIKILLPIIQKKITLPEYQTNTDEQFKTLYKEHENGNIDLSNAEIAIITHAYHFPRVNRYFDNKPNFDFFFIHNTKPIIFLVD